MKPIDGRQLAEQARAQYNLELSDARALTLAEMVRGYLDAARRAAQVLPMEAEPAQYSLLLEALGNGDRP
jgi:hypothetical protein